MADEKDIAGEEQAGGGKKKLILIVAVAAALLLGGGGAAFFLLGGGGEEIAEDGEAAAEEAVVEEADPVYLKLDPEFVVSLPAGGPAGMLQIAIEVMTRHPTVVDTLKSNEPMIRHHLLNLLETQQAADLNVISRKIAELSLNPGAVGQDGNVPSGDFFRQRRTRLRDSFR